MTMLLSLLKKENCHSLWRSCGISTNLLKGKSNNFYMKAAAAALVLFPKKDHQDVLCTFSEDRLVFCRVFCCINDFFWLPFTGTLSYCHRHVLLCQCTRWLLLQIFHPHTLCLHTYCKGPKAVVGGPHACKYYCPNVFLSLCVYHNICHP